MHMNNQNKDYFDEKLIDKKQYFTLKKYKSNKLK